MHLGFNGALNCTTCRHILIFSSRYIFKKKIFGFDRDFFLFFFPLNHLYPSLHTNRCREQGLIFSNWEKHLIVYYDYCLFEPVPFDLKIVRGKNSLLFDLCQETTTSASSQPWLQLLSILLFAVGVNFLGFEESIKLLLVVTQSVAAVFSEPERLNEDEVNSYQAEQSHVAAEWLAQHRTQLVFGEGEPLLRGTAGVPWNKPVLKECLLVWDRWVGHGLVSGIDHDASNRKGEQVKELSSRSFAPGHWPDLFGQPSPNEHVSEGERDGQAHVVLESCVPPFVFHFSAQKFIQKAEIQFVLRVQYDVGDDIRSWVKLNWGVVNKTGLVNKLNLGPEWREMAEVCANALRCAIDAEKNEGTWIGTSTPGRSRGGRAEALAFQWK